MWVSARLGLGSARLSGRLAGLAQLSILVASALVPSRLRWRETLASLPRLHRQMHWVYGSYVVLCIVAFSALSLLCAEELSSGSRLARGVCLFVAVFWGARVVLQAVFDVREHLTTLWLRIGYHALTVIFVFLTLAYGYASLGSAS